MGEDSSHVQHFIGLPPEGPEDSAEQPLILGDEQISKLPWYERWRLGIRAAETALVAAFWIGGFTVDDPVKAAVLLTLGLAAALVAIFTDRAQALPSKILIFGLCVTAFGAAAAIIWWRAPRPTSSINGAATPVHASAAISTLPEESYSHALTDTSGALGVPRAPKKPVSHPTVGEGHIVYGRSGNGPWIETSYRIAGGILDRQVFSVRYFKATNEVTNDGKKLDNADAQAALDGATQWVSTKLFKMERGLSQVGPSELTSGRLPLPESGWQEFQGGSLIGVVLTVAYSDASMPPDRARIFEYVATIDHTGAAPEVVRNRVYDITRQVSAPVH